MEFTAPVEVSVVVAAKITDWGMPKRASLPSMGPPASSGAVPCPADSNTASANSEARYSTPMTARIAYPWRLSPTRRPNVRGRANGITRIRKHSKRLVHPVGFSNGWEALAL